MELRKIKKVKGKQGLANKYYHINKNNDLEGSRLFINNRDTFYQLDNWRNERQNGICVIITPKNYL